jgi:hypothetical protein
MSVFRVKHEAIVFRKVSINTKTAADRREGGARAAV